MIPILMLRLYGRIINLNVPTLCVFNGHAVAGGLFIGLSHDRILMVDNPKIKLQFNESLIGMAMYSPFAIIMKELLSNRANRTLLLGTNVFPKQAYELDIV